MNVNREGGVVLAGTQVPLVRPEQATPGAIITGIAMQYAWQVYRVHDAHLELIKLPVTTTRCADDRHSMTAVGRGTQCSRCGLRRQLLEEFFPRTPEKPRAYVITPAGELATPQPFTLYGYLVGDTLKTVSTTEAGQWSEALALIPQLHVLWTIPEPLRQVIASTPPADEEEIPEDE